MLKSWTSYNLIKILEYLIRYYVKILNLVLNIVKILKTCNLEEKEEIILSYEKLNGFNFVQDNLGYIKGSDETFIKEQNKLFIFLLLCRSVCLTNFLSFFYTDFFKSIGVALMGSKHCVAFQWRKYYQDFYFPDPRPPKPDPRPSKPNSWPQN